MDSEEDILVELRREDIEELAEMYESHRDELPHLYSFFKSCIKSKKIGMLDFVTFYSPRNCWREDGTFIASMPNYGHDIVLHSLDPSGENLMEGLAKTRRFQYLKEPAREFTLFYAVHEKFSLKMEEVLNNMSNIEILWIDPVNLYCLEQKKSIKFNIKESSDTYVKELEPEDLSVVTSAWPFRYPDAENKFLDCIKLTKGSGVYLKSNNQLVSWVTASCLGQMTALQTLNEHKHKGYATLAVMHMAKQLAENDCDCCGTVYLGNTASEQLLEKLGFRKMYTCRYIAVRNKY